MQLTIVDARISIGNQGRTGMSRNVFATILLPLIFGNVVLPVADSIRKMSAHAGGGVLSNCVRCVAVTLIVLALFRSRSTIPEEYRGSAELGIVGVLLVNVLPYLGELLSPKC